MDGFKDIVAEVQNSYQQLGMQLLDDANGLRVKSIETAKRGDPGDITVEVLRQWLQGKGRSPVTWEMLVECLQKANLNVPADYIEKTLFQRGMSSAIPSISCSCEIFTKSSTTMILTNRRKIVAVL